MTIGPEINAAGARPRPFVIAWVLMLLLAGVSAWTAFSGLGIWAPVLQFGIATIQTAVLFALFMRLKGRPSLKWVFAITGFFWLLFLYGLSITDYSSRQNWPPAPMSEPGPRSHQEPQNGS